MPGAGLFGLRPPDCILRPRAAGATVTAVILLHTNYQHYSPYARCSETNANDGAARFSSGSLSCRSSLWDRLRRHRLQFARPTALLSALLVHNDPPPPPPPHTHTETRSTTTGVAAALNPSAKGPHTPHTSTRRLALLFSGGGRGGRRRRIPRRRPPPPPPRCAQPPRAPRACAHS